MNEEAKYMTVEVEEPKPTKVSGISFGGPNGELDESSALWRQTRTIGFKERNGWRTVIPCDRCVSGIELRRFTTAGKVITSGWFCLSGEMETSPCATCNSGKQRRNGRKKVLYDLTNSPIGFEGSVGGEIVQDENLKTEGEPTEYRGGSKPMASKEDDQMPRRLVN